MLVDEVKNTPALSQSGDYVSSMAAPRLSEVPPAKAEQRWDPGIVFCLPGKRQCGLFLNGGPWWRFCLSAAEPQVECLEPSKGVF